MVRHLIKAVALSALCLTARAEPRQITSGSGNNTEACWSPDGQWLVYQSDEGQSLDLWVVSPQTGQRRQLTESPAEDCFPAWSPDGSTIVFASNRDSFRYYNLYAVPAAGGDARRLTWGQHRDYMPAWSSDGSSILFSSTRWPGALSVGLFEIPASGGEPVRAMDFPQETFAAVEASRSPDGGYLVMANYIGFPDNWGVYLTARGSERFRRLTDRKTGWYAPCWSPDSRYVACASAAAGQGWDIWILAVPGGEAEQLTAAPGNERSPAWSPDGRLIVYEANQDGVYDLFVTDITALPEPGGAETAEGELQALDCVTFAVAADALPLSLYGVPVGTAKSLFVTVSGDPAAAVRAAVEMTVKDADEPKEADIYVNGQGPFDFPVALTHPDDVLTADLWLDPKTLKQGRNEVKFVFADNLMGTTGGYIVRDMRVHLYVRKNE